jgi:hypothetical protein
MVYLLLSGMAMMCLISDFLFGAGGHDGKEVLSFRKQD